MSAPETSARTPETSRPGMMVSLFATALIGFLLGSGLMLAIYILKLQPLPHTASLPPATAQTDRLIFEARQDRLTYRAHIIGLSPGTPVYDAIMAGQPGFATEFADMASVYSDEDIWVETLFEQTVQAGPLISLLRTDYIRRGVEDPVIRYASSLIHSELGTGFTARDLFLTSPVSQDALDTLLCQALLAEISSALSALNGEPNCTAERPVSFFDGPPMALLPSETSDSIGGVAFYLQAGRLLPDAAGEIVLTIPQSALRDHVRAEHQHLFNGSPRLIR